MRTLIMIGLFLLIGEAAAQPVSETMGPYKVIFDP